MWNNQNRQPNDLYATRPHDVKLLYKYEPSIINGKIWECACGHGHIVRTLQELGANDIYASDLIDYGYGYNVSNFLRDESHKGEFDTILTNPPYKYTTDFIIHALEQVKDDGRVIMLLPTTTLAGVNRYKKIFSCEPPKYVYVFPRNTYALLVAEGEDKISTPKLSHSWFIWEKEYKGDTIVKWLWEDQDVGSQWLEQLRQKNRDNPKPKKPRSHNIFGMPGIRKRGSTYEVRIKVNGKYIHIGRYTNEDDAINARKQAELKYRGGNK
jgi:hypothetical protein